MKLKQLEDLFKRYGIPETIDSMKQGGRKYGAHLQGNQLIYSHTPLLKETIEYINHDGVITSELNLELLKFIINNESSIINLFIRDKMINFDVFINSLIVNNGVINKILNKAVKKTKFYMEYKKIFEEIINI